MSFASGKEPSEEPSSMNMSDGDSTSNEGSVMQQTEVEEEAVGCRTSSSASSESSMAVNCNSYPTEVVVHGSKVRKVRVLFKPFPPAMSATAGQDSVGGQLPRRRVAVSRSIESMTQTFRRCPQSGSTVAQATDDVSNIGGSLPLSQEETSSSHQESVSQPSDQATTMPVGQRVDEVQRITETRIRQEIQNGIAFLEERMEGLVRMNVKLRTDLENEIRSREELKDEIVMVDTRRKIVEAENYELKQQLDSREKEVTRLADQAKQEWQLRVTLEETTMEMKRDKAAEFGKMKEMLDAKNAENKALEVELKNRKHDKENNSLSETAEILAQINMLKETVRALQKEKERVVDLAKKLETEVELWKQKYESSCHEIEIQMGRFETLKNSFTELESENQRLAKTHSRILREPRNAWSASVIDLSDQTAPSLPGSHVLSSSIQLNQSTHAGSRGKTYGSRILTHGRKKFLDHPGNEHSGCSLPPVQKSSK